MPENDRQLLERFARTGAEDAFRELVERHIHLVWSAARRIHRCEEGVRDVAQEVFTRLARKATTLPADTVLSGWLHRTACHVALQTARNAARRTQRERDAMQLQAVTEDDAAHRAAAEALWPVLDEALDGLPDTDREALLLRYLAAKPLAEVGAAFGIGEDAAQKRVARAVERLREGLRRRGVAVTGGLVTAALSTAAAELAPAGAAAAVSAGALASAAPLTFFVLMKTKLAIATLTAAVLGVPLVLELRQNRALTAELTALRARTVLAAPRMVAVPGGDAAELARLREEHGELLRLRGEVTQLRRQPAGGGDTDLAQRLREVEARAADAEEALAPLKAASDATLKQILTQNAGKSLGLAARIYAKDHGGLLPTTFEQFSTEIARLQADDKRERAAGKEEERIAMLAAGFQKVPKLLMVDEDARADEALKAFEFFPHEQVISERDADKILFREREPRRFLDGTWQRAYCFADGRPHTQSSPSGDFSGFEREHTATAANAPKVPATGPKP